MEFTKILNHLSSVRFESQSTNGSVLNKFVVPFFIDKLDLREISHSVALVGSRGSGKSTYIQSFSHATRFDQSLEKVDEDELKYLLLYWKPDIAYCQGLKENWMGEHALSFFMIHASLAMIEELTSCIKNVKYHFPQLDRDLTENRHFFDALSNITNKVINSLDDVFSWLEFAKYDVSTRLNPINVVDMIAIEPKGVVNYLLAEIKRDSSLLKNTLFKIFIDEFELLNVDQQKLINTYRKESNKQLSWNVAYKSNALVTSETSSDQWLQRPDDYTEQSLDELLLSDNKNDYKLFASEIFFLTLQNAGLKMPDDIDLTPEFLGKRDNLRKRSLVEYKDKILGLIESILPTPGIKNLSDECLNSPAIKTKYEQVVKEIGFNKAQINKIRENPSLAITVIGTYKQRSFNKELIIKYVEGKTSPSEKESLDNKISTYEYSTLLSLNLQHSGLRMPLYAGFERYCTMTTPNIRHFKELCLNAFKQSNRQGSEKDYEYVNDIGSIPLQAMHLGAISTSTSLVREVVNYPPYGKQMAHFVNRIGELFRISQKSSYQTEPERVVFTFPYEFAGSDIDLERFINSALSWRAIIDDDSKRIKDDLQMTTREFLLNPIYSPRFGISYRKKRGITFSLEEIEVLRRGDSDAFENMKKSYQKKWRNEDTDEKHDSVQSTLF